MADARPVAVVTGASRGAGRGIAVALGSHGCTVYVTGRTKNAGDHPVAGSVLETAAAVTAAGGKGVAVPVDHSQDDQVRGLFERIRRDEGRLDILVNNAFATHDAIVDPAPFWKKPLEIVDVLDVGLRSGYVASYYAAPLMVEGGSGLIVFTSSQGAAQYAYGPAYGAHKAGVDKFAADMAVELRDDKVAVLSIWLGLVLTERVNAIIASNPDRYGKMAENAETPEFTGHIVWALHNDPNLMELSGDTVIGAEMAQTYGILDEGGRSPPSRRQTHGIAPRIQPKVRSKAFGAAS
jgi:NAD(P)-dependent dehydrogenase (short-subunit alcohol dehydrogenase family)